MMLRTCMTRFRGTFALLVGLMVLCGIARPIRAQTQGAGAAITGPQRPVNEGTGTSPAGSSNLQALYTVHPGDTLTVTFRFTPEFNDEVVVSPDGRAVLKAAGAIEVAGKTLPEIRDVITRASADKLVDPDVAVTLKDFDRPHVIVAGQVDKPGRYELRKPTTAIQAVMMAGGPTQDAALGRVILFRRIDARNAEVHVLDLGKYDAKHRVANDMVLQPDDMLLVRQDVIARIGRIVKLANIGLYFDPLQDVKLY